MFDDGDTVVVLFVTQDRRRSIVQTRAADVR